MGTASLHPKTEVVGHLKKGNIETQKSGFLNSDLLHYLSLSSVAELSIYLRDPWRVSGHFNTFCAFEEKRSADLAVCRRLLGCDHGGRGSQRGSVEVFPRDRGER